MSQGNVKCTDCGGPVDSDGDTPEALSPCPKCGSSHRKVTASMVGGRPSNYMLDNFVAHKLSSLTKCGALEITNSKNWLGAFILNSVFIFTMQPKDRAYLFNFLRRAEGAISSYQAARLSLIEYLETPRNTLSPYFRALLQFEVCISQCNQGLELLATVSGLKKTHDKGDESKEERLYRLYIQSKHMNGMIEGGKIPTEAAAGIWITNQGLECSDASLSFDELVSLLNSVAEAADRISRLELGGANAP